MEFKEIAIALLTLLTGLIGWVVTREVKRTDNLERRQTNLITSEQFKAHEDQDTRTFDRMTDAHSRMQETATTGFKEVTKAIADVHIDVLHALADKEDKKR